MEDVTLLRAEALAVLGERQGAIDALNIVRAFRYNVDNVGATNSSYIPYSPERSGNLIDAIFNERNKEFMGEGYRWFDLVRYHKIVQKDPKFMNLINSGGIYWPIDQSLIDQNPELVPKLLLEITKH
ncbi:RagB/SusD family nutrient uptake outer membrane protein [Pedobacter steynii]